MYRPNAPRFAQLVLSAAAVLLAGCESLTGIALEPPPSSSQPTTTAQVTDMPRTLVYQRTMSDEVWKHARQRGVARCINIVSWYGDREGTGTVDLRQLQEGIDERIPHGYDGYATIDLERPYFNWLREGPGTPHFRQAETQMRKALRQAKLLRPKAQWAFWGLPKIDPFPVYPPTGAKKALKDHSPEARQWLMETATAPAFLAEQDWYCVSVYDRWGDGKPWQQQLQLALVQARIQAARQVARGKPVIACVWHRQHDGNNTLLTKQEWARHQISAALEAGADGVVWWAHDLMSWKNRNFPKMPETTNMSDRETEGYFNTLHAEYLQFLVETVRSEQ